MKKPLNIYFIDAIPYFPVCDAGAVVIAETPKKAADLVAAKMDLHGAGKPKLIGISNLKKPQIIYANNGDY